MGDLPASGPFRGRAVELNLLRAGLGTARTSGVTAVLLGGEAGVGKSRLVARFCEEARADGAVALTGRALDIDDGPSFWPVVSALREHTRGTADDVAAEIDADLRRIDAAGSVGSRVEMLETLCRLVVRAARSGPAVLVLDDLHWADRSTRDLLVYLVASLADVPLLLVGTYREDTGGGVPQRLATTVAELRRHRSVTFRTVEPLTRPELQELLAVWAPGRPDIEPLVWRHSGGNVFLAEETVRAVLGGDPRGLPATVRDLVRGGVTGLSGPAQRVVRAVAAGVVEVPHRLLADVLGRPGPELADAVREAAEAGFVVVDGEDGYRLRHGLMAEVVAADLLPAERIELHGRYARALTDGPDVDRPGVAARLAHHWQLADQPDRALVATIAAAGEAEQVHGYAEAYRHWLRAASLRGRAGDGTTTWRRPEFLERAAESAELAGDHDEAVALLAQRLADPDVPAGLPEAGLRARLGRYLLSAGQTAEAEESFRRAVDALPSADGDQDGDRNRDRDADPMRAEVLAGHAGALLQLAEFATAQQVARRALEPAREVGEPRTLARVLATLGFSSAYLDDPESGLAALAEAVAVAERAGDPAAVGECLMRQAELLSGPLNALDDGVAAARAGAARMRELGLTRTSNVALLSLAANGLFRLGRWDEASDTVAEAWASAPAGAVAIELRLARARLTLARGDFDDAERDLAAVALAAPATVGPRHRLPLLILEAGLAMWRRRPLAAFEHVCTGLDIVESGTDDLWSVAPLLWHGARAHADAMQAGDPPPEGQVRRLRRWYRELSERAEHSVPAVRSVLDTYAEMCAAEDERARDAPDPARWSRVAGLVAGLHQPYPEAYARLRSAEVLLGARVRSADGTADLVRAASLARGLGAVPLLDEIEDLAIRARVPLEIAEPAALPDPHPGGGPLAQLTRRELDVLEVLAEGLTNREIAAKLFISEKTVGVHLSRVFTKLGVHSRVQAAGVLHRSRRE